MGSTYQPNRLRIARERLGLRKKEMAALLAVTPATLARYEDDREPEDEMVRVLADELGVEPDFFFSGNPPETDKDRVTFRALSRMTSRDRNRALATLAVCIEIVEQAEELFELPKWRDQGDDWPARPEDAARAVRAEWGLADRPIPNAVHLLESKGVRVFSLVDEPDSIDAFAYWSSKSRPLVFLNQKKSAQRSRFDACHELGHLVLHREQELTGKIAEKEANEFASAFLMPAEAVFAVAKRKNPSLRQIDAMRVRFGVSVPAMAYRLRVLNILTEWRYKSISVQLSQMGLRTEEELKMTFERSHVWPLVFSKLREGDELGDFCTRLGLPKHVVAELTFGSFATVVRNDARAYARARERLRSLS